MNRVSIIMPYYEQPQQLVRQLGFFEALGPDLKGRVEIILCDDGSRDHPLRDWAEVFEARMTVDYQLLALLEDVRWNWIGARNRAAHEARHEWLLMTDIDHAVPLETITGLLTGSWDPKRCYDFARRDMPDGRENTKRHPNSWFMTRKTFFDRVGAYDERWSGIYGSDGEFRRRCQARTRGVSHLDLALWRFPPEAYEEAATTRYRRKTAEDRTNRRRVRQEIARDPKTRRLTFDWERIA